MIVDRSIRSDALAAPVDCSAIQDNTKQIIITPCTVDWLVVMQRL